jgi:Icc-related predicted phosphoesterase
MKNRRSTPKGHRLKILAVSDFLDDSLTRMVETKTLEPVDLIISCGDMAPEYLSFLRDRLDRPLMYVKGNHDIRYSVSNPMGCENIHARVVRFKSMNILGLEGSIWYNGGVNQYTDAQMKKIIFSKWFSIWKKGGIDMVVTHAPPRHIHDAEDRCHMGFESFVSLIHKRKPDYFLHGHIHKEFNDHDERITQVDQTQVINICGYTILEV